MCASRNVVPAFSYLLAVAIRRGSQCGCTAIQPVLPTLNDGLPCFVRGIDPDRSKRSVAGGAEAIMYRGHASCDGSCWRIGITPCRSGVCPRLHTMVKIDADMSEAQPACRPRRVRGEA